MKQGSVAKRYASALVGLAQEQNKVDETYQELARVEAEFTQNPTLRLVMNSPVVKPSEKKALLKALAPQLQLSLAVENLLKLMIDNERLGALPVMVLLYRDQADEWLGRVRVQIKTASALGDHEKKLKGILEKTLRKKVLMEVVIDPTLLGGLVVQVQDQVFDASLLRELQRIKASIAEQAIA